MPIPLNANLTSSLLGINYNTDLGVNANAAVPFSPNVTPAKKGVLTVRTDADTGSLTMDDVGHGITTAALLDVYWTNADGTRGSRRHMTVGTVAGAVVPVDGGAGDNLPLAAVVIYAKVPQQEGCSVIGNDVIGIVAAAGNFRCTFVIRSAGGAELLAIVLEPGKSYIWTSQIGTANPLAGTTPTNVLFSHMSETETVAMNGGVLYT